MSQGDFLIENVKITRKRKYFIFNTSRTIMYL